MILNIFIFKPRPLNATIFGLYILIFCIKTSAPAVISSLENIFQKKIKIRI
jgi:hypothetical protein